MDPIGRYMQEYHNTPEYEKSILRDLWHYPSKGEYPKEGETVLLLTNEGDPHLGHFANDYYWETDSFVRTSACIKCWQYIVPPKEEE